MRSTFSTWRTREFYKCKRGIIVEHRLKNQVDVVNKIEDNLDGLKGVRRVTSSSQESFANVRIEILDDAGPNEVLQVSTNAREPYYNVSA